MLDSARGIWEEHGGAALAYAKWLTRDAATAEDVVQEALLRAWRHPSSLANGKGSVRGWLLTVVRNIIADRARAQRSRPAEVAETVQAGGIEHDHADRVVDSMVVFAVLGRLSAEHRAVLEHLHVHGRTVVETAEVLGIPVGTVKSRSHNAMRVLRGMVSPARGGLEQVA
ncbi:sigma-70 family RNA polymerase sigma factor [Pseudonocardia humida]|uniref:sigma-70 family RNA polymerase sigma factor n=1 Tax=Pseudonocardia humida TaxID=2800819 RepID=UPI00207D0423|nr:sigma-70 family RNA polymerase sigma factor [Pseudonocardia humida]